MTAGSSADAHALVRASIAKDLRKAREHAWLTQNELAERLGKSQTTIGHAESGTARVSERYVRAVFAACGLPEDWNGQEPTRTRKRAARARGSQRNAAGMGVPRR